MASTTITNFAHLKIPLEHIVKATNNFDVANRTAKGAYKGVLSRSGMLIKIVACKYWRGDNVEFQKEISLLSDLKHPNLVSLIGFCDEKNEKIIVIKQEVEGSLVGYLNNSVHTLTWTQRLRISVGVARALSYLHHDEGRGYGIIHRNINSYTILLDKNYEAKLSGFMIAVKQPVKLIEEVVSCEPAGTYGYFDPAIEKSGGVTLKSSDIYSFGVVLFELLCGRTSYIDDANDLLAPLAKHHYENETLKDIVNPQVWKQIVSPKSLIKYSEIAYTCLKEEPTHRPDIRYIVDELEEALELQQLREHHVRPLFHYPKFT